MLQHEITRQGPLLDPSGRLAEPGWAKRPLLRYRAEDVRANRLRLKEWDYYITISDKGYALALCIADNRYMGLVTATLFDFNAGRQYDHILPLVFPMGKLRLPSESAQGDIVYQSKTCDFRLLHTEKGRRLACRYNDRAPGGALEAELILGEEPRDTMVIATPWKEDPTAFYYNQKINCMSASGYCKTNGRTYQFDGARDRCTLDWGRGVWTYNNTWYWGSGNGIVDGHEFGYNIGYGFGDPSAASENMLFYDGVCHKLDRVSFLIPADDYNKPWRFTSSDGRFEMDFIPFYDNVTDISACILSQHAHQVFGRMSGTAVLDDGRRVEVRDLPAFAERVHNRY